MNICKFFSQGPSDGQREHPKIVQLFDFSLQQYIEMRQMSRKLQIDYEEEYAKIMPWVFQQICERAFQYLYWSRKRLRKTDYEPIKYRPDERIGISETHLAEDLYIGHIIMIWKYTYVCCLRLYDDTPVFFINMSSNETNKENGGWIVTRAVILHYIFWYIFQTSSPGNLSNLNSASLQ